MSKKIERVDKYTLKIDGYRVSATTDQERTIRSMDDAQLDRFLAVMGHSEYVDKS